MSGNTGALAAGRIALPNGRRMPILGFGASSFWAKPAFATDAALAAVRTAVEEGITYIDTAPSYAAGEAERRVGLLLKEIGQERVIVSTKFGTVADASGRLTKNFSPKDVAASLHGSLQRLGVASVDILILHSPTLTDLSDDLFAELLRLKEKGLTSAIGLWSHEPSVHVEAIQKPFDLHMLQYNYTDHRTQHVLQALQQQVPHRVVINGTALAQGIFNLQGFLPRDRRSTWYLARLLKNNPLFLWHYLKLQAEAKQSRSTPLEVVMRDWLKHPAIHCGVFGSTRIENIQQNARAARAILSSL
ncbi:MAG: aldo/keto reductase [Mitsuaria chitosanitabida]|uniref:aldo/keto reductase n=1 Tax=Roseateles chitosanitabidus TaxID=65048 RepID=UPI001B0A5DDD|nr:aldo/keto reductase [Roseateles chitosanitabidus]MBO9688667.1 aldo/keto reductase [Roseateles chitosanitabidus]